MQDGSGREGRRSEHGGRVGRAAAILVTAGLLVSLGSAGLAAAGPRNSFSGDFDLIGGDGTIVGHAKATTFEPTPQRLVPGTYEFKGAPSLLWREIHAQIGRVDYWHDPNHPGPGLGGANVAFAEGVQCAYIEPGVTDCGGFAVMFIDVLDPSRPDETAFADTRDPVTGDWHFDVWNTVGKGEFNVRVTNG